MNKLDRPEVLKTLKQIMNKIAPEIEFDKLDLNRSFRDQVEIDSFDFYKIIVEIHKKIGVNLPDSILRNIKTINELVDFICTQ